jgi:hypothetical protein
MTAKRFKSSKAQAAFEFLTTYGWAFLVILIMVGTLAYFGILNPSQVLPSRCTMGAELQCLDHQVSATANTFRLRLKNGVGESVTIPTGGITLGSETTTQYSCTLTSPVLPLVWQNGVIQEFTWDTCNSAAAGFAAGSKGKVLVTINYYSTASGANYQKQIKGEVFTSIV